MKFHQKVKIKCLEWNDWRNYSVSISGDICWSSGQRTCTIFLASSDVSLHGDEMQIWNVRCKNVRNVWLLAQRKLGAKGQRWCSGPMLRSRFRRSSFGTPLAAIAAPGGTMKGSEVGHSSETADLAVTLWWPDCVQLSSGVGFLITPFINLREEKRGGGVAKKWKDAQEELLSLRKQWMASIVVCTRRRRGFMRPSLIRL